MKKVAIVGSSGKMGKMLVSELMENFEVVGIDKNDSMSLAKNVDIVIDFSTAKNSIITAKWCEKNGKSLIVGATGHSEKELKIIMSVSEKIPVMIAGNFSLGILRLKSIIKNMKLENLESVTIFEKHHKEKKDKPSGTALELKKFINAVCDCPVEILSLRGGKEIGLHEVYLYFDEEVMVLSHQAFSRQVFARGVERAALYMLSQSKCGIYKFDEI